MNILKIIDPKNTINILCPLFLLIYTIIPMVFYFIGVSDLYLLKVSFISCVSILSIKIGEIAYKVIIGNKILNLHDKNYYLKDKIFAYFNIYLFIIVFLILIFRAESIPIISALKGADAETLSVERGLFMKLQSGFGYFLIYLFSMQISSIIPYCLTYLYEIKSCFRNPFVIFTLFASVSTLVKTMFFNVLIPIFSLKLISRNLNDLRIIRYIIIILSTLIFMVSISGFNRADSDQTSDLDTYFSVGYQSQNTFDFITWRLLIIPIIAARDTLIVHDLQYSGNWLMGSTSGVLSKIIGEEKIDMEREVFNYQYGGMSDIGNTNATFFIDAYVNFGYLGVVLYGFIVAVLFKTLISSNIKSAIAIAPLFAIFLYGSSLVGILTSNGFILIFLWLWVRKII